MAPRRYFTSHREPPAPVAVSTAPLLTVAEVREKLTLRTDAAVYWHIAHSGLPVRRIGRAIRVDQAELEQWTRRDRQTERPTLVVRHA